MIQYVVFDLVTGSPVKWGQCQPELVDAQAEEGQRALATSDLTVDGNRLSVWSAAKEQRDLHINAGAITPFGAVDSDDESRANVAGGALAALIAKTSGTPFSVTWTMLDNSTVTLDADAMISLGLAVLMHVDACHARARALRAEIESAVDMAALLAINVGAGWP